jgi:hypothetical protein
VNSVPSNVQRRLAAVPAARFREYLDAERRDGRRYLGGSSDVVWLAAFAPSGPAELQAFVLPARSPEDLSRQLVDELATGIATAMGLYAELGHSSSNLALYGAPRGTGRVRVEPGDGGPVERIPVVPIGRHVAGTPAPRRSHRCATGGSSQTRRNPLPAVTRTPPRGSSEAERLIAWASAGLRSQPPRTQRHRRG